MKQIIFSFFTIIILFACSSNTEPIIFNSNSNVDVTEKIDYDKLHKAYFASGCFWCLEAIFESVEGVEEAVSGYSGGKEANPTYEDVGYGRTTHTEAVEVHYNPDVISYATLLEVYYGSHDPTTVNGQRPDYGTQYRSMILCNNDEELQLANDFKKKVAASGEYSKPIATEIMRFKKFWKAEDYHQNYERLNPNNSYVRNVSIPRLNRFKKKFPQLLKINH